MTGSAATAPETAFEELKEFLLLPEEDAHPVHEVRGCVCRQCGGRSFEVAVMAEDEGSVRRTCVACGTHGFIADSAEFWDDDEEIEVCACNCGHEAFTAAAGFSLYEDGESDDVRWVYVALRCEACQEIGVYEDWKIGYGPSGLLLDQV
ncbi:hypothetical protein [Catellatospora chokoriensis]|uniref:Uncharacterized protein n=1 Tax=Catellatospora chokoriensis TaxID=310353 RepID=A0A8J3JNF2_9ACTN|nr:hypothetical protein [Catellatospora chokoriensis]GIF88176.1 hypothetical protein Cch02nite_16200 [Catellatospora chokoriensis]